jgi:crossover junction endodeoxyribonuclease RuvC
MSVIAGIDPGLSGGLFLLDPGHPSSGEAFDLPVHLLTRGGKKKREVDIQGLLGMLSRPLTHAFVELAGAMPGQGVSGVFAFGKCFGVILGVLAAREIPITLVPPAQWKRALAVPKAKDGARARASQLFPAAAHQWRLAKHDGRAEAALIALYGLRQLGAGNGPSEELTQEERPHAISHDKYWTRSQFVGRCSIDTGLLYLGDPSYVIGEVLGRRRRQTIKQPEV